MVEKFNSLLAVCSFLGTSGYNYHARGFFTALNKYMPVAIKNWSHDDNPYYLTDEQKTMIAAASGSSFSFGNCITVCLHETNHEDWYKNDFKSPKIAFNVWESTKQPDRFFDKLLEFDQIWVPSEWQKQYTILQGAPAEKVFVIPEGIDTDRFKTFERNNIEHKFSSSDKFTFTIVGRWEYRKAITEIIQTFNGTFKDHDDVELLLLVDNPFDRQRKSTEDKLLENGLDNSKIKVIHKVSQSDYDMLIKETDCFVSCSRAEGWNLPLCEFMACGVPVICSNWSGQLEFAKLHGNLVKNSCLKSAWSEFGNFPGEYVEPDFEDFGCIMSEIYADQTGKFLQKAKEGADFVKQFTWDNAAKIALKVMEPLMQKNTVVELPPLPSVTNAHSLQDKKIRSKDIFVIDCFPNNDQKMNKLVETIKYVQKFEKPVALVTHYPMPTDVMTMVDYFVFDADNTLPDYRLPAFYTYNDVKISGRLDRPYHSLPIVKSLQNVCKLFLNYERIHFLEYDINLDLDLHIKNVANNKDKEVVGYFYEGTGIYTSIVSFKPSVMLEALTTRTINWEDYKKMVSPLIMERDLIFENWIYKVLVGIGKNDQIAVLNPRTINMEKDEFKELPKVNFIFSETDTDENILFITHQEIPSKKFKVDFENPKTKVPYKFPLIDRGGYSYVVFSKELTKVLIKQEIEGKTVPYQFDVSSQVKGDFVFFKGDIKCKKIFNLGDCNSNHNVQVKNFFIDGAFIEIVGPSTSDKFQVSFTDWSTGQEVHKTEIGINCWTRTNRKYYTDWHVKVISGDDILYDRDISYFQRRVMVVLDSKAMGDTLAWFSMVEEFRKKHSAQVIVVSFWNKFFRDTYPEIIFGEPGNTVPDIFAQFNIGCFDNDIHKNKFNWRITPLQKVAADILGIEYKEVISNISYKVMGRPIKGKYVALSEHTTFMCKYWLNPTGWSTIIKYLNDLGYQVVAVSKENTELEGVVKMTGKPIEETINSIHHADLFIGMSSGPSWLTWAIKKPLVLISGYSAKWAEMDSNNPLVERVINENVCHGCFNDPSLPLERGNWRWCPRGRDFECSKMISSDQVIASIDKLLKG